MEAACGGQVTAESHKTVWGDLCFRSNTFQRAFFCLVFFTDLVDSVESERLTVAQIPNEDVQEEM